MATAKRDNVDVSNASATFTQHDGSAQIFANVSRTSQLFGVATVPHMQTEAGSGNTFLQLTGGGQHQLWRPGLWLRLEGTASTNRDRLTGLLAPRQALSVGFNGQLTSQTTIGLNVYADRAAAGLTPSSSTWLTRSTLRVTHRLSTGTVRMPNSGLAATGTSRVRGTGNLIGVVFADWNGNGTLDAGEEQLAGIPVDFGTTLHVSTARDGQFAFMNVPAGAERVRLDLNALPVDFDPPAVADISVDLGRGDTRRVTFGLLPLGTIRGRVVEDANRNGQIDPGEPPVEGAVVTLDGGQRSELVKKGAFR